MSRPETQSLILSMSAFPAASDSHHHRHSDSRCLPRRHLDSMLAYHSILFLSKLGPKGQNMGHTPVTEKRPISGQNAKVLTVNTAESSVFCPEQRTNRIKFRRIDRNCYRRLINDRGSPGDSVLSLSHPVSPLCICKSASKTADNGEGRQGAQV